ncbi:SID1 transmembrane family member 1-like [Galleria mellonella]|uniref:SID1 transmembrane family member 1-like n=1 Tax=Galleria mellonella TaxID=7137 RepID=A0ABM3MTP9_GALME|nr:SID1 transmembrane family member 1-like [Galleria mellonella]
MFIISVWLISIAAGGVWSLEQNVTVIRERLEFDQEYTYTVQYNTEYILEFVPSVEDGKWPSRVWVSADGVDTSRPLLITYRQTAGAGTWQLPYYTGDELQYEFERSLCPDDSVVGNSSYCGGEREARGEFSLHVVSACAAPVTVRLRARIARDWLLPFDHSISFTASLTAPQVHHYRFLEEQGSVRLQITADDDVCAIVAVQNYSCPILEMVSDIEGSTVRMTMQRSGAVQVSRSKYPLGFYVVVVVLETDIPCIGDEPASDDWLWQVAMGVESLQRSEPPREKRLDLVIRPALSRSQYVIASVVSTAVFLGFYVGFGVLVLMQRWPTFGKYVWPKAVLAKKNVENGETQVDSGYPDVETSTHRRRRRGSDATFDSSDNSDSDEELPTVTTTPSHVASPASPASPADPGSPVFQDPSAEPTYPREPRSAVTPTSPISSIEAANHTADTVVDASANGVCREHDRRTNTEQSTPFGLPAELRLAALSRRRARVLAARSDRYLHTLATVAVFYALPVVQFVIAFQLFMNVSGALDLCYYNFLCAHPAGEVNDFNHVFSNIGYLLLGALFLLQLRRRKQARKRAPRDEEYGIPAHYGLLSSLGVAMMVVALLSATYHICPNRLNFQFDTAFMYVMSVLAMVKIYQARHPDVNARAHATFGVLAVLIAFGVWGVLGGGSFFWAVFTVLHVFTFLMLSLRIYYIGQFRLEKETLQRAARELRSVPTTGIKPLYTPRLVMLIIANAVNWAFALYGLLIQSADFASHLLNLLLCNTLMYMIFYLVMKILHGERPRWYVWCFLLGALAAWGPGLYFFMSGSSSWSSTPAQSRQLNHECHLLQFYDSHDLWHMLSAIALFFSFNTLLTWDDGLAAVKRTEIAVF